MAPLRSHVAECPSCRAQLETLSRAMSALERLPHLAPPPMFADKVMSSVQVFEPWHIAMRDRLGGLVPQSAAGRLVLVATGAVLGTATLAAAAWVARRADAAIFLSGLALDRARDLAWGGIQAAVGVLAGESGVAALQSGGTVAVAGAIAGTAAAVAVVALGLKSVASAGQRRRS